MERFLAEGKNPREARQAWRAWSLAKFSKEVVGPSRPARGTLVSTVPTTAGSTEDSDGDDDGEDDDDDDESRGGDTDKAARDEDEEAEEKDSFPYPSGGPRRGLQSGD